MSLIRRRGTITAKLWGLPGSHCIQMKVKSQDKRGFSFKRSYSGIIVKLGEKKYRITEVEI